MLSRMSERKSEACVQKELGTTVKIIHKDWPFVGSEGRGRAVGLAVHLGGGFTNKLICIMVLRPSEESVPPPLLLAPGRASTPHPICFGSPLVKENSS